MKNSELVESLRPESVTLDPRWADETLQRLVTSRAAPPVRPVRGHRVPGRAVALVAAAAVVGAGIAGTGLIRPDDATAADLMSLAASAASYDGPVLAEGTWLHERTTSLQHNSATLSDGAVLDTQRESWTSWDGRSYLIERRPSTGRTEHDVIDDDFPPSYADPTPQFAASLPTTAEGLLAYLSPLVTGSSSHDEALFEALTRLATSHTLPPQTLAATFEALTTVDGVRTEDVDVDGRPAVEVTYDEQLTHSTDELTVDRATGQVLATHQASRQSDYVSTTELSEVVTELPAPVRAAFDHVLPCPGVAVRPLTPAAGLGYGRTMRMNSGLTSNAIAGAIAFVIYLVISLATGASVGAALLGALLLGLFTFVVSFIISRIVVAAKNR